MQTMKYVYGPVPSRRLGLSLGISPIPKKTCNYSCIYCQLGRTNHLTNKRDYFYPVEAMIDELDRVIRKKIYFDAITIVGEGEPTLYLGLGKLIDLIKQRTDVPLAVITNGALLYEPEVQSDLMKADIIMPSLDAYEETLFRTINRPVAQIHFSAVLSGLIQFSHLYRGHLWIEIMLIHTLNDDDASLHRFSELLKQIRCDKCYLNTPVRPPAEQSVQRVSHERMMQAAKILNGISIDLLESNGFHSEIEDHYEAIFSIIKRHPMNQFELKHFLRSRGCADIDHILRQLTEDDRTIAIHENKLTTFRLK